MCGGGGTGETVTPFSPPKGETVSPFSPPKGESASEKGEGKSAEGRPAPGKDQEGVPGGKAPKAMELIH